MKVLEGLFYSKEHEWVRVDGSRAYIGITDYAQHQLGDIVYVELPDVGAAYELDSRLCIVESVKAVADVHMPVSGRVVDVNSSIDTEPQLINQDAYEAWIAIVEMANEDDLKTLMGPAEYREYVAKS